VGRKHSQRSPRGAKQRGALDGPSVGFEHYISRCNVLRDGGGGDVFHDNTLTAMEREAAGGLSFVNGIKEVQKIMMKATLRNDTQTGAVSVEKLQIGHIAGYDENGLEKRVDLLLQGRRQPAELLWMERHTIRYEAGR